MVRRGGVGAVGSGETRATAWLDIDVFFLLEECKNTSG